MSTTGRGGGGGGEEEEEEHDSRHQRVQFPSELSKKEKRKKEKKKKRVCSLGRRLRGFLSPFYLLACQVRIIVGDSGFCFCVPCHGYDVSRLLLSPLFVASLHHWFGR